MGDWPYYDGEPVYDVAQKEDGSPLALQITDDGKLRTTATLTGDINVDTTSVDTNGLCGKISGGDFTTEYQAPTKILCGPFPNAHVLIADDVITVVQTDNAGVPKNTYSRDDATMTVVAGVLTVIGATFSVGDTFVVYTNIDRSYDTINLEKIDGADVDVGVGNAGLGTQRMVIADDDTNLSAIKTAIELLDDLQGALKSIDTDELITRITDSAGAEINPAKEDGNLASLLAALLAKVSAGNEVTHRSPQHFSATFTSSSTLTLAGAVPTITNNAQIVKIVQIKADNTSAVWTQGENCTLTHSGGVVSIHGVSPFVTGDDYAVCLSIMQHALDTTQDVIKGSEQSPAKEWYTDFEDYTTFAPDTVAYADGGVISAAGKTDINFAWSKTASDADNNYIKVIYLKTSGSAVDHQEVSIGSPVGGVTSVTSNIYEVDKAAGVNAMQFPTKGFPYMKICISKATDDGTDSTWTTYINKRWA